MSKGIISIDGKDLPIEVALNKLTDEFIDGKGHWFNQTIIDLRDALIAARQPPTFINCSDYLLSQQQYIDSYKEFFDKLPETLDIGKRIKVKESHIWAGRTGTITQHYIDKDHCSGTFGRLKYAIENDDKSGCRYRKDGTCWSSNNFSILVTDVEFID